VSAPGKVVAYADGVPVGCGGVTMTEDGVARLWFGAVVESARGQGIYRSVLAARLTYAAFQWDWQQSDGGFRVWDTLAKGDLVASNLNYATKLFTHTPVDWSRWTYREVCSGSC
jgi:hypothetical protein